MPKFENHPIVTTAATTTTTTATNNFNEQVFINSLGKLKTNRKKYDCNQCSKYFTRPSALQTHIYTHTGEKPHGCDMPGCGRRFAVISNLRRHLRVHRPSHVRRRLTSQERREYVEKLIQRSGDHTILPIMTTTTTTNISSTFASSDINNNGLDEGHMYYNTFPSMCYSSSTSSCSSSSSSSSSSSGSSVSSRGESMSPTMESTTYRLLKPKETRPLCLTVKHLLN